jgi:isoquinoline 1-oxidoreductase beta subunit
MMLVTAAANDWNVDASQCKASNGTVTGPGGKKATYGQLAAKAAAVEVPKDVPLKPSSQFKIVGNSKQRRLDTEAKVKGTAQFGIDTRVPGMLYAAVAMSPIIGGKVASFDDSRAKAMPGVKAVVQYSRGVAVVADSYWQAKKAKDLLQIQWDGGPNANNDSKSIWEGIRAASEQPGAVFRESGNVESGMGQAAKKVESTYQLPFLSHSPMEPMNTTADVRADKAIIITPTQFQQLIPHVVGGATGLKPEQVEVHTTFLGGGFGRRVEVDYAIDAAEISKAVGAPVKMVWSREDDMTHDSYRPASLMKLGAGLDASGKPVAMRFHSTSPSISARLFPSIVKDGIDPFAVEGIDNYPYDTPNIKLTYQMHDAGVTPGYWRGVSHNLNAVALECFVDELANAAGKDPIQYRIDMLDMGSTKHQWSGLVRRRAGRHPHEAGSGGSSRQVRLGQEIARGPRNGRGGDGRLQHRDCDGRRSQRVLQLRRCRGESHGGGGRRYPGASGPGAGANAKHHQLSGNRPVCGVKLPSRMAASNRPTSTCTASRA